MFRNIIKIILPVFFLTESTAQFVDTKTLVDSLKYFKQDTIACTSELYWRIIGRGKEAIPPLIDLLTDTSTTAVKWHCKKGRLRVGEVAQFALMEIAFFPAAKITGLQFDLSVDGCWNFYDYFFDNSNKAIYQAMVKDWYNKHALNYRAVKISKNQLSQCRLKFNLLTYYDWEE